MKPIVRQLAKEDYKPYKELFDEAYYEYLERTVIGHIATQTIPYMRGYDKVLWIEYIVTKKEHRRQGTATALLKKLKDYAKQHQIDSIYATINPDNTASIKLHHKLGFNVKNWKTASL